MGLGWAICKRLVELHGGEIGVHSSGEEGAGSTFYFTLPLVEPETIHAEDQPLPLGSEERVLLLTNQSGSGEKLRDHLVQKGYEVSMVQVDESGDWFSMLLETLPGAVVLDVAIAPTQGWNILKTLKENPATRAVPLLFYSLSEDKGAMLELDYLTKPVGTAELGRALEYQKLTADESKAEKTFLIVDAALARKRKLGSEAQRLVRQAMAYVHEHYAEPISRENLAHNLGMSSDYLTLCFRGEVGMTFIAYLNRYRVNQAKVLLAESDKNVTEIAMAVGFSDSGYCSRVFRRQVGISPDAYRRT